MHPHPYPPRVSFHCRLLHSSLILFPVNPLVPARLLLLPPDSVSRCLSAVNRLLRLFDARLPDALVLLRLVTTLPTTVTPPRYPPVRFADTNPRSILPVSFGPCYELSGPCVCSDLPFSLLCDLFAEGRGVSEPCFVHLPAFEIVHDRTPAVHYVKSLMPNAECLPYTECPGPKRRNALYLTRFECMRIAYINSIYSEVQLYDIPRPLPLRPLRSCYPLLNISPPANCCTTQCSMR